MALEGDVMKKLIVSMKSTEDLFSDFKKVAHKIKSGKVPKTTHHEISFESKKDFNKFIRHISVLMAILNLKPKSVYALAKITNTDVSNMKKVISFFEAIGAIHIKEQIVDGRLVKTPVVDYKKIEFYLEAA